MTEIFLAVKYTIGFYVGSALMFLPMMCIGLLLLVLYAKLLD